MAKGNARAIRRGEVRSEYSKLYELEQQRNDADFAATRDMRNKFYAGVDPRRRQEMADGGMVREDRQAMANLSPKAIHHEYPYDAYYGSPYLDDTVKDKGYSKRFAEMLEGE